MSLIFDKYKYEVTSMRIFGGNQRIYVKWKEMLKSRKPYSKR